jgi:glycosyltransferase involved in cell wall biosynthesis
MAAGDRELVARHGIRRVAAGDAAAGLGAAINAGARAARGRVLVLLAEDAVPADAEWLSRLLAPFAGEAPPAAVQGGIQAQFVPGGPPYDPFFTAETRRWRQRMGGFAFSIANAAVRRDVWERLPAIPSAGLADRHWQRELAANAELILPCWAAAVHWIRPLRSETVLRDAWHEGRHWRGLGLRYRLHELIGDLWRGTGPAGASGEMAAVPPGELKDAHRRYGLLRPPAIYLGNHILGGPPRARYNARRGHTFP